MIHGSNHDLIFIDCPPQLGKLLTAALYSATHVLMPCAADAMGLQGLADLAFTIEQVRKNVNGDLQMLGAVINLYKPQRNLSADRSHSICSSNNGRSCSSARSTSHRSRATFSSGVAL